MKSPEVATPNAPVTTTDGQQVVSQPTFVPGATTLRDYASSVPTNVYYFPNPSVPLSVLPESFIPLWQPRTPMDLSVYVSEEEYFTDYSKQPDWKTTELYYSEDFEAREHKIEIPATKVS